MKVCPTYSKVIHRNRISDLRSIKHEIQGYKVGGVGMDDSVEVQHIKF